MRKLIKGTVALAASMGMLSVAPASAANVEFDATVTGTCTLEVTDEGSLAVSADFKTLSSKGVADGQGGVKAVATDDGFTLSVTPPATGWKKEPAGNTVATDFATEVLLTGATVRDGPRSTPQTLKRGTTDAAIDLTATNENPFMAGDYTGEVVVTCD